MRPNGSLQQLNKNSLDPNGTMYLPAMMIPSFRVALAFDRGVQDRILFKVWGGLGDQICAEPMIRYAMRHMKECKFTLAAERPELFQHLAFDEVFNIREKEPDWDRYLVFNTIVPPSNLVWEFFSHCITNAVDFPALCALRQTLPIANKEIILCPDEDKIGNFLKPLAHSPHHVLIHAGKHWPSKTFPKDWWDEVLRILIASGKTPVLIGANTDDNRGTVNVETDGCLDLRNKTTIEETIWLTQRSHVLLTNDSSPLHMAASHNPHSQFKNGDTWIGFVATCKHPDFIQHWRRGQWAWRMKNFGKGGMWDLTDYCPNKNKEITVEHIDETTLRSWLPSPEEIALWAVEKSIFER